jgi:hypothetical protein
VNVKHIRLCVAEERGKARFQFGGGDFGERFAKLGHGRGEHGRVDDLMADDAVVVRATLDSARAGRVSRFVALAGSD